MYVKLGWEKRSFNEAINSELKSGYKFGSYKNPRSYLDRGLYYGQISNLNRLFREEEKRIFVFENIIKDFNLFIENVRHFLEISDFEYRFAHRNKARKTLINPRVIDFLRPTFKNWPNSIKRPLKSVFMPTIKSAKIDEDSIQILKEFYQQDINYLSNLIGDKLSVWNYF